ncbi:alpha-glucan family phosphorylase [Novipirellula artificiosorum]|uniref:glycogen phosphorylase n=1 Tax=Novipirellula artificiosorum TaxID=2528016 RepID=A0A5C6DRP6_9BACT|nr:alpha-glucan family phosphorylase [Novipirellula artificiosorum]TWU39438.1 Glycogen phosphorylase [Novipirellula artificiosorum]
MNQKNGSTVAYFSMEIALDPKIPTYSGGLGILAGDTIRSAADLRVPMVAVTLLHRKGYFAQAIDSDGWQHEAEMPWEVEKHCEELPACVEIYVDGRPVFVKAWRYMVSGATGDSIAVLLLDTDLPENSSWDRTLTDHLYGGDSDYRLCQEVVLGIGGVRILRALGFDNLARFHMNEGHAALLGLELLDESARFAGRSSFNGEDVQLVQQKCVFTTHTPVPAGHDRFPFDQVRRILGRDDILENHQVFCCAGELNMTYLALNLSHYVNGVAKKHGEVSRKMLVPKDSEHHYSIDHITNGVHLGTWAARPIATLFDRYVPGWREDNASLRGALAIPAAEAWKAHQAAKQRLVDEITVRAMASFDVNTFTIGFARRATAYKRSGLLLHDSERLREIARKAGPIQVVFAGKAHPDDEQGKQLIRQIVERKETMLPEVKIVFLENYDWDLGRVLTAGVDVWLNTPQPPMEASGTSGMKAALNGVPSLSSLDGWWIEGCVEDTTGWAIGNLDSTLSDDSDRDSHDASSMYQTLENSVIPKYYEQRKEWTRIMLHAISLNASYFNTQRMVQQYVLKAYYA